MSGKAGSVGAIVLGAVIGIVAIYTQQYYLLWTAATLIAGGAVGLSYRPKSDNQSVAAAQDVKIATAATGLPVPVVFGVGRVTPNFLRVNKNFFKAVEVKAKSQGGKGGGGPEEEPTVGFNYYLKWEFGLCMGEVDEVGQVFSMPGERAMISAEDPWVAFSGDSLEITLESSTEDTDEDDDNPEGGIVRIYRGAPDQLRLGTGDSYAATGLPYENVCWAMMGIGSLTRGFCLGSSPNVSTYQFMLRRRCRCVRDDGSTVEGIKVRGSDDPDDPSYHLANPAAIYYEAITNKVWGRGLSSDIIDEASFVDVSEYYATKNIGLGLTLDNPDELGSFLEGIQRQCKTLLTWDGEHYALKSLLDTSTTHGEILTLRDSELENLTIGVPLWESTVNEVRAEFTSSERGERPDSVSVQDLGNADVLGGRIVSQRLQLPGFNHWNLAYQQVARMLSEMSYPWRSATWEMNRFRSHVAIGEVVRVVWTEYTDNPVTSYWMVVSITDSGSDSENVKVTAVEDQLLSPVEGEDLSPTVPATHPWERLVAVDPDDIYLADEAVEDTTGDAFAFEVPEAVDLPEYKGTAAFAIFGLTKMRPTQVGAGMWRSLDDSTYSFITNKVLRCVAFNLVDPIPGDQHWDRSAAGVQFDLDNPELDAEDILFADEVVADTDDLTTLGETLRHWVFVEEEVLQVGSITQVAGSRYRMRNFMRGLWGTRVRRHAAGLKAFYVRVVGETDFVQLQHVGREYFFRLRGFEGGFRKTYFGDYATCQFDHPGDEDGKLLGLSGRPLAPEPVSVADGTPDATLVVRPRRTGDGAGIRPFNDVAQTPIRSVGATTFAVVQLDAAGAVLSGEQPVPTDFVFVPPTLTSPGTVTILATKLAGVALFRVYSVSGSKLSQNYAEFAL